MPNLSEYAVLMKEEWNRRLELDADFWMAEWPESPEAWTASGERDFHALVCEEMREKGAGVRVLEYGCGTGRLTQVAARYFGLVRGVDISDTAISNARSRLSSFTNVSLSTCDGTTLSGEASASYDLIFSYAVLNHLNSTVLASVLGEMVRVLEVGGRLSLHLYVGDYPKLPDSSDTHTVRGYSSDQLKEVFRKLGCAVPSLTPCSLPFDGDFEKCLKPTIVETSKVQSGTSYAPEELGVILEGNRDISPDSYIECNVLYDRFNRLVKQGETIRAVETARFLLTRETRMSHLVTIKHAIALLEQAHEYPVRK